MSFDLANWESQARKGLMEMVLLGLLRERERYGYELVRDAQEKLQQRVVEGTVYPLLARLDREGLVSSAWRLGDAPQPRKYYALTPEGQAACTAMARAWHGMNSQLLPWLETL